MGYFNKKYEYYIYIFIYNLISYIVKMKKPIHLSEILSMPK